MQYINYNTLFVCFFKKFTVDPTPVIQIVKVTVLLEYLSYLMVFTSVDSYYSKVHKNLCSMDEISMNIHEDFLFMNSW